MTPRIVLRYIVMAMLCVASVATGQNAAEDTAPAGSRDMFVGVPMIQIGSREHEAPGLPLTYTPSPEMVLVNAAAGGNLDEVQNLIVQSNVVEEQGEDALFWAAMHGHEDVTSRLIDEGLSLRPEVLQMLLCYAGANNDAASVRCLLALGGRPTTRCDADIVQVLLGVGERSALPLHMAANYDAQESIEAMLAVDNIDINALNDAGVTALMIAANRGQLEIVACLLDHDADIDQEMTSGFRALHLALGWGYWDVVELLLDSGAELDIFSAGAIADITTFQAFANEFTDDELAELRLRFPLMCWAALNPDPGVVNLLAERGVEVDFDTGEAPFAFSPLTWAICNNNVETALALLDLGADPNGVGRSTGYPLYLAMRMPTRDVEDRLLELGADPTLLDEVDYWGKPSAMGGARFFPEDQEDQDNQPTE
jgi:ankyrin repeat protein